MKTKIFLFLFFSGFFFGKATIAQEERLREIPEYRIDLIDEKTYFFGGIGLSRTIIEIPQNSEIFEYESENSDFTNSVRLNFGFAYKKYLLHIDLLRQNFDTPRTIYENQSYDQLSVNSLNIGGFYKLSVQRHVFHVNFGLLFVISNVHFESSKTQNNSKILYEQGLAPAIQFDLFLLRDAFLKLQFAQSLFGQTHIRQNVSLTFNILYKL